MNLVITQALATGLPVIATRHSGLPDQVIDDQNGYLVAEGDFKNLAEKIIYYFDHPEIWPAMSHFARRHVKTYYNSEILINKQISYYQEIYNKRE